MLINGRDIKKQILEDYRSLAEFSRVANVDYNYLAGTLNGLHLYNDVISVLRKFGYNPVLKSKNKNQKKEFAYAKERN